MTQEKYNGSCGAPSGSPPRQGFREKGVKIFFFPKNGQVVSQIECHDYSVAFTIAYPNGSHFGVRRGKKGGNAGNFCSRHSGVAYQIVCYDECTALQAIILFYSIKTLSQAIYMLLCFEVHE